MGKTELIKAILIYDDNRVVPFYGAGKGSRCKDAIIFIHEDIKETLACVFTMVSGSVYLATDEGLLKLSDDVYIKHVY